MDQQSNFIVVWEDGFREIVARRYHHSGTPIGDALSIDKPTEGYNYSHTLGMSNDGSFIVLWNNSEAGIKAQRYSSSGTSLGSELAVDGSGGNVAMDASGNFVIVGSGSDGFGSGIFAQRFGSNGDSIDARFQVNGFTFNDQSSPVVCVAPGGDFVVAWKSAEQDGSDTGIFVRHFDVADQPTPTPVPRPCPGDCDGDDRVTVAELVLGVNVVLGTRPLNDCRAVDHDDSLQTTIDELVAAVRASLSGC